MKYAFWALLVATSLCTLALGGLAAYATWLSYGWTYYIVWLVVTVLHYVAIYFTYIKAE